MPKNLILSLIFQNDQFSRNSNQNINKYSKKYFLNKKFSNAN